MRLYKVKIAGYGRIRNSTANLDAKVIALVGPNEAGKTTFLNALLFNQGGGMLPLNKRTRTASIKDSDVVVTLYYSLDSEDTDSLDGFKIKEPPTTFAVGRTASGGAIRSQIQPMPVKNPKDLKLAAGELRKQLRTTRKLLLGTSILNNDSGESLSANQEVPQSAFSLLSTALPLLEELVQAPESTPSVELLPLLERVRDAIAPFASPDQQDFRSILASIQQTVDWLSESDPEPEVWRHLWKRVPQFLQFTPADRDLLSKYQLSEALIAGPPPALVNLLSMAGIELDELWDCVQSGDQGPCETMILQGNRRLSETMKSWSQANLTAHLTTDHTELSVLIKENDEEITVFDERSDGLRMFIALQSFLHKASLNFPPILLIDEADTHLHWNAQRDLVSIFQNQQSAAKVIYTTHSPACLPPDLGTGIRCVVPAADGRTSEIHNGFWTAGPGFSQIMIVMGASAAAIATARYVVMAEGPGDMILFPSLLRNATGLSSLPYQIAPGIAETPKERFADLDLEGARVCYLVDDNRGGRIWKRQLLRAGIAEERIVVADFDGPEDYVDARAFWKSFSPLLQIANPGKQLPSPPSQYLKASARSVSLVDWAKNSGLEIPSKTALAGRIVEDGNAVSNVLTGKKLKSLHRSICKALGIPA